MYLGPELLHSKIATGVLPDINWLIKELATRNPGKRTHSMVREHILWT